MKTEITLNETELTTAVKQHLKERGYKKVSNVRFAQTGFPNSSDPREQGTAIEVTADVEAK